MAAALAIDAHGRTLRLAAEVVGVHFQGLAALAGCLCKRGCSDRRLLRRLSVLDAAVGVLRHITVVSVHELEEDLRMEMAKLEHKEMTHEEQAAQEVPISEDKMELQLGAPRVVPLDVVEPPPERFQLEVHPVPDPPLRLGGRVPNPPFGEGAKRARVLPPEVALRQEVPPVPVTPQLEIPEKQRAFLMSVVQSHVEGPLTLDAEALHHLRVAHSVGLW